MTKKMMNRGMAAVLACLFLPACFLLIRDGMTMAKGSVLDADNAPIAGALIVLSDDGGHGYRMEAETDAAGAFSVGGMHEPGRFLFTLTVRKAGFRGFTQKLDSNKVHKLQIVLTRDSSYVF